MYDQLGLLYKPVLLWWCKDQTPSSWASWFSQTHPNPLLAQISGSPPAPCTSHSRYVSEPWCAALKQYKHPSMTQGPCPMPPLRITHPLTPSPAGLPTPHHDMTPQLWGEAVTLVTAALGHRRKGKTDASELGWNQWNRLISSDEELKSDIGEALHF